MGCIVGIIGVAPDADIPCIIRASGTSIGYAEPFWAAFAPGADGAVLSRHGDVLAL